jgi:transposase-like protein
MKRLDRAETQADRPADAEPRGEAGDVPLPLSEDRGWLAASERRDERPSPPSISPIGRGLRRIAASWRYLADPAERHALLQHARNRLARIIGGLGRPGMAAGMQAAGALPPPPAAETDPAEADPPPPFDPEAALARLHSALRQLPDKGETVIPGNLQSLDRLLSDPPPALDFEAADLLHDCFPRGTRHSANRVLLAVARNLTRHFGRPGRLPMTAGKAWSMLNPAVFGDQMAAQLAEISDFILAWQAREKSFLILEFAEVELIEYLFEHLHPRRHGILLIRVMDFKVLSTRRAGLLRRIPARVRRFVQHTAGADPKVPLAYARDTARLLELMERQVTFRPVVEAAAAARAEVDKIIEQLAPQGAAAAPPPAAAGEADIGHIKRALSPAAPPPAAPPPAATPPTAPPALAAGAISASAPTAPPVPAISAIPARPPAAAPRRRRFGDKLKTEAVMRRLQGAPPEQVAAAIGATPELVESWLAAFLKGGSAALGGRSGPRTPAATAVPADLDDLKSKLQSLLQTVDTLSSQIQTLADAPPSDTPPSGPPPAPKRPRRPRR